MSQNDEEIAVVRLIVRRAARQLHKLRRKPSLVHVLTLMVLLLSVAVAYPYVRGSQDDGPQTPPAQALQTPAAPPKGIDMKGYCRWLGFPGGAFDWDALPAPYCNLRLLQAHYLALCRENGRQGTVDFRFSTPTDPTTGQCLNDANEELGGVVLSGYCEGKLAGWHGAAIAFSAPGEPAWWECRVAIEPSVICKASHGVAEVVAKVDKKMITCAAKET